MTGDDILFFAALFACVVAATWLLRRTGVMKPDDEVSPGWAYLRWRLIMIGVLALALVFYVLFTEYVA